MKRKLVFICCALFCALLIAFNADAMDAARTGFLLWRDAVLPALLPFFVCTALMRQAGALRQNNIAALFALAFLSGAPGGARLLAQYGGDDAPDAGLTRLAASLNTVSPMYVAGAFAAGMLGVPRAAAPILIAQLLSALLCAALVMKTHRPILSGPPPTEGMPLARLFPVCIAESVASLLSICGTIVFFLVFSRLLSVTGALSVLLFPLRALLRALGHDPALANAAFLGMLEMTAGSEALAGAGLPLRTAAAAAAFLFSFGGLCIAAQSTLFMPIAWKQYLPLKLAQGVLSALIAYLIFPLCFWGAAQTGSVSGETLLANTLTATAIFAVSLLGVGVVLLLSAIAGRRKKLKR